MKGKNNLIPMLTVTGDPKEENIKRLLSAIQSVGIGQFMLYPRDGLSVEYMGERWLEIVEFFLKTAQSLDMKVWLYDEFNWPSGSCKNTVQKLDRRFWLKALKLGGVDNSERDVIYNPDGDYVEIIAKRSHADILNPDAVDAFIHMTHEKYYERFKGFFGNTVCGMFTDEPSYEYTANEVENSIAYYDGLEDDYREVTGRDLFEDAKQADVKVPSEFLRITNELLGKRFREVYLKKTTEWCTSHGILATGHLLGEETITRNGGTIAGMKEIVIPGMDDIYCLHNARTLQAYGLLNNAADSRGHAMNELFAFGPCNMSYDKLRRLVWQSAVFGIDHYFLAITHLNANGNYKKCRWFNNFSDMQPNFRAMKLLAEEAESAVEYARKPHIRSVALRYPRAASLEKDMANHKLFIDTLGKLTDLQVQWHIADEGEQVQDRFVLRFDGGVFEERSGDRIENLTEWVEANVERPVVVTENGKQADGLIVRLYKGGEFVVLNVSDRPRDLAVHLGGKELPFHLPLDGTFVCDGSSFMEKPEKVIPLDVRFEFEQCGKGFYRAQLSSLNKIDEICCEQDTEVEVLVRQYREPAVIKLDGVELKAENEPDVLHYSFDTSYKKTDKMLLKKGAHTIELCNAVPEKPFLPLCLICGEFSVDKKRIVPKSSAQSFYGKGVYRAEVEVPQGNTVKLHLETDRIYCKVALNGEDIGSTVFAPQTVNIPERFKGQKVTLTVEQYSSVAPLFGDIAGRIEEFEADGLGGKLHMPSTPETLGIISADWLVY